MDVTPYLSLYRVSARELGLRIMQEIYDQTGIRAACGVGTNLYLAKIALDITAKPSPGQRWCAGRADLYPQALDTQTTHRFLAHRRWHCQKLASYGIFTMRELAEADEDFLYHIFGIDAELLIDHAWGREPVTIAEIKAYRPASQSLSSGQVLMKDYSFQRWGADCERNVRPIVSRPCEPKPCHQIHHTAYRLLWFSCRGIRAWHDDARL